MRWRNALQPGDQFSTGQVLQASVGIRKTLEATKDAYYAAKREGRAVGIGCGMKNSGIGNGAVEWGKARLVVERDGTVTLYNGYTEMGQGLFTVLTQFAAEVTGLPAAQFRPKVDSTYALGCGQTTGSRATFFGGRAVVSAAAKLRADLDRGRTMAELAGNVYAADVVVDDTTRARRGGRRDQDALRFRLRHAGLRPRCRRTRGAHDCRARRRPGGEPGALRGPDRRLDPHGAGLRAHRGAVLDDGMPASFKLRDIGVLRARDMPEIEVILVEEPEPEGPFGAKGVGEIGLVPTAGAVAGALEAFDGVRRYTLPMRDSAAARAMSVGRVKRPR